MFWDKPNYTALIGSKLYGTANEDSDEDLRGFVLPPLDYVLGLKRFDQYEDPNSDTVIYSFKKFLEMLINGNSQALEAIFSPEFTSDKIGNLVRDNRQLFVTKRYYRSIRGFALAEYRKARVVQLGIAPGEPKLENAIHVISSCLNLKRYQRDAFLDVLQELSGKEVKTEVPNKNVGENRLEDFQTYGYCRKNLGNTIRLLSQGVELFKYNTITFPRPEVDLLKSIRAGTITFEEVDKIYQELEKEFDALHEVSTLPQAVDLDKIGILY